MFFARLLSIPTKNSLRLLQIFTGSFVTLPLTFISRIPSPFFDFGHRRIADEYCGGAAVTKFPTKYFRIE